MRRVLRRRRPKWRSRLWRAGLLVLLAPALLLGASSGGTDLLFHAHGGSVLHAHLAPHALVAPHASRAHDHEHLGAWHDALHGTDLRPHADEESPQSPGDPGEPEDREVLVHFPEFLLPRSAGATGSVERTASGPQRWLVEVRRPMLADWSPPADRGPPEPPTPRKQRSGLATLLTSSRAILI